MCLQYFENGEELMKIPLCNHIFHENCLRRWLVEWQRCPNCDRNIIHMPSNATPKLEINSNSNAPSDIEMNNNASALKSFRNNNEDEQI